MNIRGRNMNILQYLLKPEIAVVFDVDGVLAPYEFGYLSHSMSDEEWDEMVRNDINPYNAISYSPKMRRFISHKDIKKVYVCSKCTAAEESGKREFVQEKYGILPENIFFVREQEDKIAVLKHIKEIENVSDQEVAIVEDTVKTLDRIRENGNYITVHISSFIDRE